MSLKVPSLDDRKYAAIIEDARTRIPVYTKEWSDHNVHDPGITFLELLSWIAETQIFHLDQITERHYLKYLKLLGFPPKPQRCALVDLTFSLPKREEAKIIPRGEKIMTTDESGLELVFETFRRMTITNAKIERIITDYLTGRDDNTEANDTPGMYFLGFGEKAEDGSCMYVGFDSSPFPPGVDTLDIAVRFYEGNLPSIASHGDEEPDVTTSVKAAWQYCTDYKKSYDEGSWEDFEVFEDTTMMLNQGGVVVLRKPPGGLRSGTLQGLEQYGQYSWIRCRIVEDGYEVPPQIDSILINTVEAVHKASVEDELLDRFDDLDFDKGTGSGLPNQRFRFKNTQIIDAEILVDEIKWKEVSDFDGSGPGDRNYVLDRAKGEVIFGDGIRGKVPGAGQKIKAIRYSYGGGIRGNVMPDSRWTFKNQNQEFKEISAINTLKATGGEAAESFKAALSRLKRDLKVPYRAVTLEDYRDIATHTPGLRFGRANAMVPTDEKNDKVEGSCEEFYGVKVVVVPYSTLDRPEPSEGFIDTVSRHLDRHRLLTDVIKVQGPKYVGIGVRAYVKIKEGHSEEGRIAEIEKALKCFLHPLKGGDDGRGWHFGRTVYRSEIYEVIEKVEGVECVRSVSLEATGNAGNREGDIKIDGDALVYSTKHQVMIRARNGRCRMGR